MAVNQSVLSAVFSDETPHYRFPAEPDSGDTVTIRIRVAKGSAERVVLLFESLTVGTTMNLKSSDDFSIITRPASSAATRRSSTVF